MDLTKTPQSVRTLARLGAWGSIAAIAFVTLSPIEDRPTIGHIRIEHAGAFATVGMLFGLAYPKRFVPIMLAVVGAAASLELAQHLAPDRHGRLDHFAFKAFGGASGVLVATLADWWLARWQRRRLALATFRYDG